MVYSTRRFVSSLALHYFVLVFFSRFSIAINSLVEERANLSAFCTFPLLLGIWERLQPVIVALPGLFSYIFFKYMRNYTKFSSTDAYL